MLTTSVNAKYYTFNIPLYFTGITTLYMKKVTHEGHSPSATQQKVTRVAFLYFERVISIRIL